MFERSSFYLSSCHTYPFSVEPLRTRHGEPFAPATTIMLASTSNQNQYFSQHFPDRYIRITVLHDYVTARVHEFGRDWRLQAGSTPSRNNNLGLIHRVVQSVRGYFTLVAKRPLRPVLSDLTVLTMQADFNVCRMNSCTFGAPVIQATLSKTRFCEQWSGHYGSASIASAVTLQ